MIKTLNAPLSFSHSAVACALLTDLPLQGLLPECFPSAAEQLLVKCQPEVLQQFSRTAAASRNQYDASAVSLHACVKLIMLGRPVSNWQALCLFTATLQRLAVLCVVALAIWMADWSAG